MGTMKIAAMQPVTASDFPGCMAAIVFTQGCNFRCPFCHNPSLLNMDGETTLEIDDILTFLQKRRGLLGGVVVTGGEPCLQPGLADFCRQVKKMGFKVKIDTNGSHPQVVKELLAHDLLDFIAMDIKGPLARFAELTGVDGQAEKVRRSIRIISQSGIDHLFRTTDVTPLLDKNDHRLICDLVPPGSRHIIQPFIAEHALAPELRHGPSLGYRCR